MSFFNDLLNYPFLFYGLMTSLFLSIGFGVISPFIISKEQSFLPPAISHSSLFGISIALILTSSPTGIFFISIVITSIISFILSYNINKNKLPPDVFIGIYLTVSMALGILINETFLKNQSNLFHFLFGNILLISKSDYLITLAVVIFTIITFISLFKYWIFVSYDPQNAKNQGIPTESFQYLFSFIITILVIASIKATGIILVNALALIPGLFAFQISKKIKEVILYSCIFSFTSSFFGFYLSTKLNISTGITISLIQFILMIFVSNLIKYKRRSILTKQIQNT